MFDEETATEVIKSYLKLIRDADLPEESKLTFKNCQFDSDTGISERTLTFKRDKVIVFDIHILTLKDLTEKFIGKLNNET